MAAYRATVHQSTSYSPNYLMFSREVRSPVDLVFGIPSEQPPASYDDFSVTMEERMKQAYCLVREHLGKAAERMKRQYDIRVRPHEYHRGQWVLYYNPRRYQGRQQKWQRKFSLHLVVKELPPVNYLVQKSKRSRPFITHIDKLKPWYTDNAPKSWLTEDDGNVGVDVFLGIGDLDVDGQDSVGVETSGAVNSDGVGDVRRDDAGAGVGATGPCDSNSMMDVGRSDENAGVGVRGLDSSYNMVKYGQGGGDAGVRATALVNSGGVSGAERCDALVVIIIIIIIDTFIKRHKCLGYRGAG